MCVSDDLARAASQLMHAAWHSPSNIDIKRIDRQVGGVEIYGAALMAATPSIIL